MTTRKTTAKPAIGKNPEQKKVSVTLAKPHTHRGIDLPAGAKIDVYESRVAWLQDQGVVAKPETEVTP